MINPPEFFGLKMGEDPQLYINEVKKKTLIMHVTKLESVKLALYQLKDVSHYWFKQWKKGRGDNTNLVD